MTQTGTDSPRAADRRSEQRSPNVFRCSHCKREWTGHSICHSSCCHRTWTGVEAFDRHRVGPVDDRRCLDPETAVDKNGNPVFTSVSGKYGVTWRRWRKDDRTAWYEKVGQAA